MFLSIGASSAFFDASNCSSGLVAMFLPVAVSQPQLGSAAVGFHFRFSRLSAGPASGRIGLRPDLTMPPGPGSGRAQPGARILGGLISFIQKSFLFFIVNLPDASRKHFFFKGFFYSSSLSIFWASAKKKIILFGRPVVWRMFLFQNMSNH